MIHCDAGRWLVCLAFLMPLACASGERGLTLGAALERTLSANPDLAAHTAELEATTARAAREALPPPFTAGVEVENFAGSGALSGIDSAESTVRLGRVIELGGKREARRALGDAEMAREDNRRRQATLEATTETRVRFVEVLADQQRLALAREQVDLSQRARDEVAEVVRQARNPETDLHSAEIVLADAELEREHAEHELSAARVALASRWGSRTPDFDIASGSLDDLPEAGALETLVARLERSPRRRDALLQLEVLKAKRQIARSAAMPDLNASVGVRRLEEFGDHALVMSVSMPLGSRARASLDGRESEALSRARDLEANAAGIEAHRALHEQYQELMHARSEHQQLRGRMLPAAEKSLQLAQRGFEAGRFPYTALAQAQERLMELRRRRIDSAARYLVLLAGIELLTAEGVSP